MALAVHTSTALIHFPKDLLPTITLDESVFRCTLKAIFPTRMLVNLLIFAFSLYLVVKGATLATTNAARLAAGSRMSEYAIGFVVVSLISILPETFISINSAIQGTPAFGLGTLLGSNIADLTLIFAILTIYAGRGLKVESKLLRNMHAYPLFLLLPLILGIDGYFSRAEGAALVIVGALFYYLIFRKSPSGARTPRQHSRTKSFFKLLLALILLLAGSYFTVLSAADLALSLNISPILIGMLIVSLGTTMPELFFSIESVRTKEDGLAIGDILGTVLADALIVVGILALIHPYSFPSQIIYVTGVFMFAASFLLFKFMNTGRIISKKEGGLLLLFWVAYVVVQFWVSSF